MLAVYVGPSLAAIILALFAQNRFARGLLLSTGAASLLILATIALAETDCQREIATFYNCRRMPASLSQMIGLLQVLYVMGYFTLGPILVVAAAIAEWRARRRT